MKAIELTQSFGVGGVTHQTITESFSLRDGDPIFQPPKQLQNGWSYLPLVPGIPGLTYTINGVNKLVWIADDDFIGWLFNGHPFKTDLDVLYGGACTLTGNYASTPKRNCSHLQNELMAPDVQLNIQRVECLDRVSVEHDTELTIEPTRLRLNDHVMSLRQALMNAAITDTTEYAPTPTFHATYSGGRVVKKPIKQES